MKNIEKVLNLKSYVDSQLFISEKYHDLINMFEKKKADKFTSYQEEYNIKINLKSDKMSNFESLYNMSWEELQVLCEYFDEQLAKEFIQSSCSSFVSSVLFAKKSEKELYFYINYQVLNVIIIWNWYSIFLIQETLDQLSKAWYFMKLDIIHMFNWIHIYENDEKYTAFWTRWELFEQLMMLFSLKNELSMFQHYINDMLHEFLDVFIIAYINDILIYLNFLSEHWRHVWLILKWLWEADL